MEEICLVSKIHHVEQAAGMTFAERASGHIARGTVACGGRILDQVVSGNMCLELGGQYISPLQKRLTSLSSELGIKTPGNGGLWMGNL